jgi:hypothetical protein
MLFVIGARGRVHPILACNVHISLASKHPGDEMGEVASSVFLLEEPDGRTGTTTSSTEYRVLHVLRSVGSVHGVQRNVPLYYAVRMSRGGEERRALHGLLLLRTPYYVRTGM